MMKSRSRGWKESGLAVLFVALNVFLLAQVFDWGSASTVFAVPYGQGQSCTDTGQCVTGLSCADGFCCNTACNGPQQACDLPGAEGTCSIVQTAPTLSLWGQLLAVAFLLLVGWNLLSRNLEKQPPK